MLPVVKLSTGGLSLQHKEVGQRQQAALEHMALSTPAQTPAGQEAPSADGRCIVSSHFWQCVWALLQDMRWFLGCWMHRLLCRTGIVRDGLW